MTGDDAEAIAWRASSESGLDDRPDCDPCVLAAAYLEMELAPVQGATPHINGRRIIYPAGEPPDAVAYYVGHEVGHVLVREEYPGLDGEVEEQAASRVGVALVLPRRAYLRDLGTVGWDLDALRLLWPLASLWIHARRIAEVTSGAIASRWTRTRCVDRVITEGIGEPSPFATPAEYALARAAMRSGAVESSDRMRAWPTTTGAIVLCDVEELRETADRSMRLGRTAPRITRR